MICVVGSLNMDLVIDCQRIPSVGETVIGKQFHTIPGGKGANQAVACGRLGAETYMLGKLGNDGFADELLTSLNDSNVNTKWIQRCSEPTGVAVISVDEQGGNSIIVAMGANNTVSKEYIVSMKDVLKKSNIIILQHEIPLTTVEYIIDCYAGKRKTIVLNPAPAMEVSDHVLSKIDFLIPNEHEIKKISSGISSDLEGYEPYIQYYLDKGVKNIIITLGDEGCLHATQKENRKYPARKVAAVDTTAAGDTFVGAFCAEYERGLNVEQAISFATIASSVSVTRKGAQTSIPYLYEIEEML